MLDCSFVGPLDFFRLEELNLSPGTEERFSRYLQDRGVTVLQRVASVWGRSGDAAVAVVELWREFCQQHTY